RHGKPVALKLLDCRSQSLDLIRAEVQLLSTLSRLRHPHIIRLDTVVTVGRYLVLVMERADGNLDSLDETYREMTGRHIPPDHLLELLAQAADALDFLAASRLEGLSMPAGSLQHCDVKPSNLLLVGDTLKVADFGLANHGQGLARRGFRGTP